MFIAHMSDVHLGARKYGLDVVYDDVLAAFEESLEAVRRERPSALVLAGDIFDSPHPDNNALRQAVRLLRELAEAGVKVVAVNGEHDTPGGHDVSPLAILASAVPNFYAPALAGAGSVAVSSVTLDGVKYLMYPFRKLHIDERRKLAKELLPLYSQEAARARAEGLRTVFVAHFSVSPVFRFDAVADLKDLPPADYAALGHVHVRCVNCAGRAPPRAYAYPSSLYPLSVEEVMAGGARGPLLVDLSGDEPAVHELRVLVRPHVVRYATVSDAESVGQAVLEAMRGVEGGSRKPVVHIIIEANRQVPTAVALKAAYDAAKQLDVIAVPHVVRIRAPGQGAQTTRTAGTKGLTAEGVAVSAEDLKAFLKAHGAPDDVAEPIAKSLFQILREPESEKTLDELLEKLASDERALSFLRSQVA